MDKMKKLAVALFAAAGLAGCATAQVVDSNPGAASPATAETVKVLRPLQSYGSFGGYRYRRFAVTGA